jgi:hypothetical protein
MGFHEKIVSEYNSSIIHLVSSSPGEESGLYSNQVFNIYCSLIDKEDHNNLRLMKRQYG